MKVIMLTDVKNVGKKGEIVDVSDGYAQNFLIRNKKAVPVSKGSMHVLKQQQSDAAAKEAQAVEDAKIVKEQIEQLTLEFPVKTGKEGKVFGSVSTKEITELLQKQHQITVDKKKFVDTEALKELGTHKVRVELFKGVVAELKVRLTEK